MPSGRLAGGELASNLAGRSEALGDHVVDVDGLEVDLLREQEVGVIELRQRLERVPEGMAYRVLHEARLQVRMLDDEELVGSLEQIVDRSAHRALGNLDEHLGIEVLLRPHEERLAPALVVRGDGDELEDPLDVARIEPDFSEKPLRAAGAPQLETVLGTADEAADVLAMHEDHCSCPGDPEYDDGPGVVEEHDERSEREGGRDRGE